LAGFAAVGAGRGERGWNSGELSAGVTREL
jgi:hypothetical protein